MAAAGQHPREHRPCRASCDCRGRNCEAIDASPGPVVAHCRSGARAFFLWVVSDDLEDRTDDEILTVAEELHLDPKA